MFVHEFVHTRYSNNNIKEKIQRLSQKINWNGIIRIIKNTSKKRLGLTVLWNARLNKYFLSSMCYYVL